MTSIYSWGANSHGQLGLGFESEQCTIPHKLADLPFKSRKVRKIIGGGAHVLILDSDNRLFACGWNHKGQLGVNSTEDRVNFHEVLFSHPIELMDIACGWDSTAAIDIHGHLFVWGSNSFGQLGFDAKSLPFSMIPIQLHLPANRTADRVCFGLRYLCVLCSDGGILLVGKVKFKDQCVTIKYENTEFFELIKDGLFEVENISSGTNHILIADNCSVIGFGDNKFGQSESIDDFKSKIVSIKCGWTHNGVLTEDGEVFLYGRNTYGQLGHSDVSETKLVQLNCNDIIDGLHLGSEHGLVRTNDGEVITWGWNEHGNCGNGKEDNVYTPIKIKLPGKCLLNGSGAGFCYAVIDEHVSE